MVICPIKAVRKKIFLLNDILFTGKNGNKRGGGGWPLESDSRSRSILKNKESRGTDSELLLQETTSLGANVRSIQ